MKVMLDNGAYAPTRAYDWDGGLDIYSPVSQVIPARSSAIFDTGVHVAVPVGCVGELKSKSGLNINHDLSGEGVIDAGYTGSIRVKLYNHGDTDYQVKKGDKIIQLLIVPVRLETVELVDRLDDTERGNNGFGSTGK